MTDDLSSEKFPNVPDSTPVPTSKNQRQRSQGCKVKYQKKIHVIFLKQLILAIRNRRENYPTS